MIRDYSAQTDFEEVFFFTREILSEAPYDEAREELVAYPGRDSTAKVAVGDDGRLVGFCAATHPYWNKVAMIDYLVVAEGARGQGLGARLVASVEDVLRELGIRHVCVQTATWNQDAVRFYERLGYARLAVMPAYFGEGNDAVWLGRDLPGSVPSD